MSDNKRTLKINPELFKLHGKKKYKPEKSKKTRPIVDSTSNTEINKVKKELLRKVKDYQKNKEVENIKEEKRKEKGDTLGSNLFEKHEFENTDFEREFNKSLTFLQGIAEKNKKKKRKEKQVTMKNNQHLDVNTQLPTDLHSAVLHSSFLHPPACAHSNPGLAEAQYSSIKNGLLPTFRQLNKTQKNTGDIKPRINISLENNTYDDGSIYNINTSNLDIAPIVSVEPIKAVDPIVKIKNEIPLFNDVLDDKISAITNNSDSKIQSQLIELEELGNQVGENNVIQDLAKFQNDNGTNGTNETNETNTLQLIRAPTQPTGPTLNRVTKKYKYLLGKKKGANHIGVLIKNRETQRKIKNEVGLLKTQSIQEIKNHLREKNLIKVGCDAPVAMLRQLYEDSILTGDVLNTNSNNLVHNFLN